MLQATGVVALASMAHGATKMPNIGYATGGYNIFYANPLATQAGVDPGFTTWAGSQILDLQFTGGTTEDDRYSVPDGFTIRSDVGCYLDFETTTTFKSSDYVKSLEVDVSLDFSGFGAYFSASVDYKHFQEHTTNESMKSVNSRAECSVYSVVRDPYHAPSHTTGFKTMLESLPSDYGDGSAFFDMMDTFGTHAPKTLIMGSRYGFSSYLTEEGWSNIEKTGVDVGIAAGYEGLVKVGVKIDTKTEQDAQTAFEKNVQNYKVISLGAAPTNGDVQAWAQQTVKEPMPIRYQLHKICELISDAAAYANCVKALQPEEYCTKRVKSRGDVADCKAISDKECMWSSDCGLAQMCENHICVSPTGQSAVMPINRYWHDNFNGAYWNTFHAAPAWGDEYLDGENIFYALWAKVDDAVAINRYCNNLDSTFHPTPAWPNEHNCGDAIFYAFPSPREGTVAINRYWDDTISRSTFHPTPEWPNEHDAGDNIFYAYTAPASCSAHAVCSALVQDANVDCCPTRDGHWLRCCSENVEVTSSMSLFI